MREKIKILLVILYFTALFLFAFLIGYYTGTGDLQRTLTPIIGGL